MSSLNRLEKEARQLPGATLQKKAKATVEEQGKIEEDLAIVFFRLFIDIERTLREIAAAVDLPNSERAPMRKLISQLEENRILHKELSMLLMDFSAIRNAVAHGRTMMIDTNFMKAIEAEKIVLSELNRIPLDRRIPTT